jgi:hypothetical protein
MKNELRILCCPILSRRLASSSTSACKDIFTIDSRCRHSEMGFPACHPAVIAINMTEENKFGEAKKISLDYNVRYKGR